MNFYIHNIKINSIATLGSFNIGNTILSGNQASESATGKNEKQAASTEAELPLPPSVIPSERET